MFRTKLLNLCKALVDDLKERCAKNSQPQEQRNSKRLDAYSHSGTQL